MIGLQIDQINLLAAAEAADKGRYPLPLLLDDWIAWHKGALVGIAGKFLAPRIAPEHVEDLWPNGYHEVAMFVVRKAGIGGLWDSGGSSLAIGEFYREGLNLTKKHETTLFWTVHSAGQFQIHVSAFMRIDSESIPDDLPECLSIITRPTVKSERQTA